jgi:hypothetical protein
MPNINLSLSTKQVTKATQIASTLGINRSVYIRRAIDAYNEKIEREILTQKFKEASEKCRDESLRICQEFESIDNIPE